MTLMLEIQAPLFENASGFLHPNLLERFLELKNVWSGIFKGYFDVEIQSYMGANFWPPGLLSGANNVDVPLLRFLSS